MASFGTIVADLQAKLTRSPKVGVVVPASGAAVAPGETNEREEKATIGLTSVAGPGQFEDAFGSSYDVGGRTRAQYYRDCDTIARNMPEAERALEIISSSVTSGEHGTEEAIKLEFNGLSPQQEAIANDFVARTGLSKLQKRICRGGLKKGDVYRFNLIDKDGFILGTQRLAPELTSILKDDHGRVCGYRYQGFKSDQQLLAPFEVAHYARSVDDDSDPHGRSLFWSGLTTAQANLGIRDAMLYETMVHSGAQNVWFMPFLLGMPPDKQRQWKDDLADAFRKDKFIASDGTLVRRPSAMLNTQDRLVTYAVDPEGRELGKPEVKSLATAPTGQIVEVSRHFQRLFCILTGVPPEHIGIEESSKDGIGGEKAKEVALQFAAFLNAEQRGLAEFNMSQIELQFALLGMPLKPSSIVLHMPDLRAIDRKVRAEIMWLRAQAYEKFSSAGLPFKSLWIDVLFDGDQREALEAAERYGIDLEEQRVTVTASADKQAEALETVMTSLSWIKDAMRMSRGVRITNGVR